MMSPEFGGGAGGGQTPLPPPQIPADLVPLVEGGAKPVRLAATPAMLRGVELFCARFPENFDIPDLVPPLVIQRDVPEVGEDEDGGGAAAPATSSRKGRPRPVRTTPIEKLPWRVTDGRKRSLVGRQVSGGGGGSGARPNASTAPTSGASNYFVMIERDDVVDLIPLSAWYVFQTDGGPGGAAASSGASCDLAERKRRAALRAEDRSAEKLRARWAKTAEADGTPGPAAAAPVADEALAALQALYSEDAGLSFQQKKKLRSLMKKKRNAFKRDADDPGDSALNIKSVKRPEVDWDFDDQGGRATDDEDEVGAENEGGDFDDAGGGGRDRAASSSDEDEPAALTKYGKQVNCALENQKEQDFDDELAQFSDEEDEEEGGPPAGQSTAAAAAGPAAPSSGPGAAATPQPKATTPADLKPRVIRLLMQQGGRMQTKTLLEYFKISSSSSELFPLLRACIAELCNVHTEQVGNAAVKFLELRPQFRPS